MPGALLIGIAGFVEAQVTDVVKICVLPSVKVPVAINCWVFPLEKETTADAGDTAIDTSVAGVTVSVALLEVFPERLAVIVVVPCATDVARPELLMLAMPVLDECHVTNDVMSGLLPSEYVPMAVYCFVSPRAMLWGVLGVIAIDCRTG